MPSEPRRVRSSERGWALASVLWAVAALSVMAAATQELTLTAHRTEARAWERARADAALNAGLTEAVIGISAPDVSDRWRVDGVPRQIAFGWLTINVSVQAEAGRYD